MLFPTIDFAIFFVFVLGTTAVARALGNTANKLVLIAASLLFYSFWSIAFAAIMVGVVALAFAVGWFNQRIRSRRIRIAILTIAIIIVVGDLAYFKYYNYLLSLLMNSSLLDILGLHLNFIAVATPVAISFFTFHAISYMVDTFTHRSVPSRSFIDVLLYISFFPHLVAGPIVRAASFIPQLQEKPDRTAIPYAEALMLIFSGLWKKMIAANYLAVTIVEPVFNAPSAYGSGDLALAATAYAFQIYFDFSAYSSIAIGLAAILGYRFPENFNQPYRSLSVQEFWRRWHITLSTWLRDYVYIPLGGSRRKTPRIVINLMITMVLGGLWHGANTTFLVWGAVHGLALVWVHLWHMTKTSGRLKALLSYRVLAWLLTFLFLICTWIVFRAPDLTTAGEYFSGIFTRPQAPDMASLLVVLLIALGFIGQFIPPTWRGSWSIWLADRGLGAQIGLFGAAMVGLMLIAPPESAPFIYFQF